MAKIEVKRSIAVAKPTSSTPLARAAASVAVVELPTKASIRSNNLDDYHILIHGEKKAGKTTLATVSDNVLLLTFDPVRKGLEIMQVHMPDWQTFMAYLVALEKAVATGKFPYSRVVIDGADIWYRACQTWAEKILVVDHISEEKWGRGWDLLKETFAKAVTRLMSLPCGCWFISHSAWREVETRVKGVKIEKLLPLMKQGGEEILNGRVDAWFAYDYYGSERILIVRGDERTGAGCSIKGHFMTTDGRSIVEVPMGDSEEEAYANMLKAFNNQQGYTTLAERDEKKGVLAPHKKAALTVKKPV